MIRVTINYNHDSINGFQLIGHAGAAEYGHDIVCAAVSALSITTVDSLSSVAKVQPDVQKDPVNGGLLIVKIPKVNNVRQNLEIQTLLKSFELGIKMITEQYAQYVRLNIIHTGTEV